MELFIIYYCFSSIYLTSALIESNKHKTFGEPMWEIITYFFLTILFGFILLPIILGKKSMM
jgi:hypothetical protein